MSIKTKIKNDLWRINYVIPFSHRFQFDEKGKLDTVRKVMRTYRELRLVKGEGRRTIGGDVRAILSSAIIEIQESSDFIYSIDTGITIAVPGNVLSNFPLDYDRIIHGTFEALAEKACGDDDYGREAALVADGVRRLAERTMEALDASNHPNKARLIRYFERMLSERAEHFDEGLQRVLFFNQIMWQTRHRLNGLGRLDRILSDLYAADLTTGDLTRERAEQMVLDFLAQLSRYPKYKSDALAGDIGQIIILGGLEPDGRYFSSPLTEIFLTMQAKLGKPDPKTFLRVSDRMPGDLLQTAVKCLAASTGSPLFSNDDVVIPALLDYGMSAEDAYSYCTSACWEPFIAGKSLDQNNIGVFDYFPALEEAVQLGATSYEALVDSYIELNRARFRAFLGELNTLKWAKDPLVSMFTDHCSERRQDISDGGCDHKDYGVTTVALSNVIDSLQNIRKLVFEEKRFTLQALNEKRINNFNGDEALLQQLLTEARAYGHDAPETIALVNRITDVMAEEARAYRNPYGGTVKFGLSSSSYNILSKKTRADFSGRRAGMAYNTHISCMDAPYTEVANFAGKLSYDRQRFNGNVVDFFLSPDFIRRNADKFTLFLKGAIKAGFFQMQMNVLDSKTLIDAKANPDRYKGLIVRVWGFSAYFNELPESYKDLLIERALAAEKVA